MGFQCDYSRSVLRAASLGLVQLSCGFACVSAHPAAEVRVGHCTLHVTQVPRFKCPAPGWPSQWPLLNSARSSQLTVRPRISTTPAALWHVGSNNLTNWLTGWLAHGSRTNMRFRTALCVSIIVRAVSDGPSVLASWGFLPVGNPFATYGAPSSSGHLHSRPPFTGRPASTHVQPQRSPGALCRPRREDGTDGSQA